MIEYLVLACSVIITLSTLAWLFFYSHYGIDLTDESYYLIWMSNPWNYSASASQFGFIYHPLYLLLRGDITLLRQANILIIFVLAWVLCMVFFRATIDTNRHSLSWNPLPMSALAAAVAICSLIYFCPHGWLATPSYNSLTFQALLLSSIGLLIAENAASSLSIIGWLLLGVGGWLTFMAKPTSAAALGVVTSACLLLTGKFNLRLFVIALLTSAALLIASAWVIDGSLHIFFDRLRGGVEAYRLLDAGHFRVFRIDNINIGQNEQIFLAFSSVIIFGTVCLADSKRETLRMTGLGYALLLGCANLVIVSEDLFFHDIKFREYCFPLLWKDLVVPPTTLILGVTLSLLAFCLLALFKQPDFRISRSQWAFALYFAVLPHVYAFGTAQNYWLQGSMGSLFWILAGLIILMPAISIRGNWHILMPAVVTGQLITVLLLQAAMERPYFNQPEPLREYTTSVPYGINRINLMLPQALSDYYQNVKKTAFQAGFRPGVPMLDLTGEGLGMLYAIGAKIIGQPWMIGGFPGSDNLAIAMLSRVPCTDIAAAWLFVDSDSRQKLSPTILNHFGLSMEKNYEMAAELSTPNARTARHGIPTRLLQLWKPSHSNQDTITACETLKTQYKGYLYVK